MAAAAAPSSRRLLPPAPAFAALVLLTVVAVVSGQRITTIQLDGTQYFVSRMNPYSPELNYFLAYQYCRSLGLQLASFESREKADSLMQYLRNAGHNKFDYWTSGNRLGTDMLLWMSTGAPFNTTFDYMRRQPSDESMEPQQVDGVPTTSHGPAPAAAHPAAPASRAGLGRARSRRPGRQSAEEVATGCVALKAPALDWDTDDCLQLKDFICEQTRCYYYNYGSIPVSTSQGEKKARPTYAPPHASSSTHAPPLASSSAAPAVTSSHDAVDESVHRRITVRPQSDDVAAATSPTASAVAPASGPDPDPYPTELPSADEQEEEDDSAREDETPDESFNFASRSFPEKDAVANVVYVTAVGADTLNATAPYTSATAEAASAAAPTTAVDDVPPKAEDATPALPPAVAAAATERFFARGRVDPVHLDD